MPVNDTTTNQGYQKPNIANTLSDDVGRLRSALDSIDTDVAARLPKSGGTMTGTLTAPAFIPNGSTVPTNGVYLPSANTVGVATNSGERLRITSDGKVGIGESSPYAKLYVSETGTISPSLTWQSTAGFTVRNGNVELATGLDGSSPFSYWLQTRDHTSAARTLAINPLGGNVGIGTTSPGAIIHATSADDAKTALIAGATNRIRCYGHLSSFGGSVIEGVNNAESAFAPLLVNGSQLVLGTGGSERARLDSSGRLLVGTSSARVNFFNSSLSAALQLEGTDHNAAALSVIRNETTGGVQYGPNIVLASTGGTSNSSNTVSISAGRYGTVSFQGTDGTEFVQAAEISAEIDGTPSANDMPGRLVFYTTLNDTSVCVEALRITNDRVVAYNQEAPAAVNTSATLTVANLKTRIITSTTAAAVTMTLPTGTNTEAGFSGVYTNMTFEWSVINTGATNAVTVQGNTAHTIVGSGTVSASNSGRFATRRTAANTWVTYRLSS